MTAHATASDIAVNILTRLAAEDLTVPWLAQQTGIEVEALQRVLHGDEPLTLFDSILIAEALETTPPKFAEVLAAAPSPAPAAVRSESEIDVRVQGEHHGIATIRVDFSGTANLTPSGARMLAEVLTEHADRVDAHNRVALEYMQWAARVAQGKRSARTRRKSQ